MSLPLGLCLVNLLLAPSLVAAATSLPSDDQLGVIMVWAALVCVVSAIGCGYVAVTDRR